MMQASESAWPADACRLRVGTIDIDLRYRIVRRDGADFELNPRSFDLLMLFLREPGVLHTREAIFRKVWRGVIVEEASLTSCIWQLRRALGEGAKAWIRTVTKQGYVFDPPEAMTIVAFDTPVPAVDTATTTQIPMPESADASPDVDDALPVQTLAAAADAAPTRRRTLRPLLAAALMLIVAGLGYTMFLRGSDAPREPQRVVLVTADSATTVDSARWPVVLLHAWIDWQLRSAPGIVVAAATETCERCTELTVVLGAEMSARNDGLWQLSVRYRGMDGYTDIARTSTTADLVATLDGVSREVVRAVAPSLGDAVPLTLDATSAEQLARGFRHEQQHRWSDAVRAYSDAVEKTPHFGYARMRLALALEQLGQQGAARAQLKYANEWIDALPEPLRAPLDAQRFLITHDYDKAAAAFAALGLRNGGDASYRPDEAYCLMRLGRTRDAAQKLAGDVPLQPAVAIRWLLQLAEAQIANYATPQAVETSQAAIDLAGKFGWEHEHARAELLLAHARRRDGQTVEAALFDDAIRRFDATGDRLGALRARYFAETNAAGSNLVTPHPEELLAEARLAGNPGVEIETLLRTRFFYKSSGDIPRMREQLAQAAALAASVGTPYEQWTIELHLLDDDIQRLDLAEASRRIDALRKVPLQAAATYNLGYDSHGVSYLRGRYEEALTTLDETERALKAADSLPQVVRAISCDRTLSHLMLGQTSAARTDIRECAEARLYNKSAFPDLANAELAIQTGDLAEARRLLAPLPAAFAGIEDRHKEWVSAIGAATLLARVGEYDAARDIVDRLLPRLTAVRYYSPATEAHITRAEIALAQGKPDDAERDLVAVTPLVPADAWYFQRRLRTVHALIAQARGDTDGATRELDALHTDAVALHDVVTELQIHSLMSRAQLGDRCSEHRHQQLIADSGLRGASDRWLLPEALRHDEQALVKAPAGE
jgi:DNA-binding winged helix-turn-helix (wHTH) protein